MRNVGRHGKKRTGMSKYRPYKNAVLAGSCIAVLAALLTVLRVGNPICARHLLCLPGFFPPTWLLFVCGGVSYVLLGGLLGRGGWCLCSAFYLPVRGLLFLVGFAFLRLCWYPLFFGLLAPLSACGALIAAIFLGVCGVVLLGHRIGGLRSIMLCELGWCLFLLVNSFVVFLLN